MISRIRNLLLLTLLGLSSCTFSPSNNYDIVCENAFILISDYNKRYPDQGDYFDFIKSSSIKLYYHNNENMFNAHYYLEYVDGSKIDEDVKYTITNHHYLRLFLDNETIDFEFTYYGSSTIDYILIGTIDYEGKNYHLVYNGRYTITAQG